LFVSETSASREEEVAAVGNGVVKRLSLPGGGGEKSTLSECKKVQFS